ncbi:hypothetical protein KFZ58_14530 [Virgibacillus sp. NKC19-16]|uniref:hypothetical protein n=1 Tax=Virgibacillus salidurans TaxID=2831673 RepID=UPI001F2D5CC1|nr:hypothetical protein [Virgibacillus sp. NKC19-16]UJL45602.1 hypothetical protein KFZ58_14530 [Virgibacillus sp. NKC19-16]
MENSDMKLILDEIKALNEKVDGVDKKLDEKVDGLDKKFGEKIDSLDKKLDDFRDGVDRQFAFVHNDLSNIKEDLGNLTAESRSHHKHTDDKLETLEYVAQKMSYQSLKNESQLERMRKAEG